MGGVPIKEFLRNRGIRRTDQNEEREQDVNKIQNDDEDEKIEQVVVKNEKKEQNDNMIQNDDEVKEIGQVLVIKSSKINEFLRSMAIQKNEQHEERGQDDNMIQIDDDENEEIEQSDNKIRNNDEQVVNQNEKREQGENMIQNDGEVDNKIENDDNIQEKEKVVFDKLENYHNRTHEHVSDYWIRGTTAHDAKYMTIYVDDEDEEIEQDDNKIQNDDEVAKIEQVADQNDKREQDGEDEEREEDDNKIEKDMAGSYHFTADDLLAKHIKDNNLPFTARSRTRTDGNCWYDALADQVVIHELPNLPRDHVGMRKAVCDAMLKLPQTKSWIKYMFNGKKKNFRKFVRKHRRDGEWTDSRGLLCQASALLVRRNIHIVGTANMDQKVCYTKLESVSGAEKFAPLTVGYYQDKHYQSLQKIEEIDRKDEEAEDLEQGDNMIQNGDEVATIEKVVDQNDKREQDENMIPNDGEVEEIEQNEEREKDDNKIVNGDNIQEKENFVFDQLEIYHNRILKHVSDYWTPESSIIRAKYFKNAKDKLIQDYKYEENLLRGRLNMWTMATKRLQRQMQERRISEPMMLYETVKYATYYDTSLQRKHLKKLKKIVENMHKENEAERIDLQATCLAVQKSLISQFVIKTKVETEY